MDLDGVFDDGEAGVLKELESSTVEDVQMRTRLLENEIRVLRDESNRLALDLQGDKEKVKENLEKIKMNKQLPYLVGNVVEILDLKPEVRARRAVVSSALLFAANTTRAEMKSFASLPQRPSFLPSTVSRREPPATQLCRDHRGANARRRAHRTQLCPPRDLTAVAGPPVAARLFARFFAQISERTAPRCGTRRATYSPVVGTLTSQSLFVPPMCCSTAGAHPDRRLERRQEEEEEDGGTVDVDAQRQGKAVVLKTTTRQTIFLPVIGLVDGGGWARSVRRIARFFSTCTVCARAETRWVRVRRRFRLLSRRNASRSVHLDVGSRALAMRALRTALSLPPPCPTAVTTADKLKPADLVGVNKDSYLILDTLPAEYDSRVKAMEVDEKPTEDYSDIGGLDKQIQELREAIVLPMTHADRFKTLGIRAPKGVLLYGPPGTGKTLIARACAAQTNAAYLKLAGPLLVQMFIGDGAKLVRDAFALAKEKAPAIIFIDEIDAIGTKRFDSDTNGDREVQRTMLELLNQLDGFSSVRIAGTKG